MNNSATIAADQFAAFAVGVDEWIVALFVMYPYSMTIEIVSALDCLDAMDVEIENAAVWPIGLCDQFQYRCCEIGCCVLDLVCV